MSILTHTEPSRDSSGPPAAEIISGVPAARIISRPLALVFLAEFCALIGFYLLLSVTPMYAAAAGAGSAGAGLVTGCGRRGAPPQRLLKMVKSTRRTRMADTMSRLYPISWARLMSEVILGPLDTPSSSPATMPEAAPRSARTN